MERGSTHFNCRGRRSVVVVFLGAFLMILRADRSFVRSLANVVGAAGASGFYTAPARPPRPRPPPRLRPFVQRWTSFK